MKQFYKTFTDGNFQGYLSMEHVIRLRNEGQQLSEEKQRKVQADHMIYAHYDLDDAGDINTIWLYSGVAKTNSEYQDLLKLKNMIICALHRLKE